MVRNKIYVCYFITMFAAGIVLAEEAAQPNASIHFSNNSEIKTEASMSDRTGVYSLLKFPKYEISGLPNLSIARAKRYAVHHQDEDYQQYQPQHLEKRRERCNYAIHLGSRCLSCHETITCLPGNRIFIRRCNHFFRYCNNGHCSMTPGALCHRPTMRTTSTTTRTPSSTSTLITTTDGTTTAAALTSTTTTTSSTGSTTKTPITTTTTSTITTPTSTIPLSTTTSTTSTSGSTSSTTIASSISTTSSTVSTIGNTADSTTTSSTTESTNTSTTISLG